MQRHCYIHMILGIGIWNKFWGIWHEFDPWIDWDWQPWLEYQYACTRSSITDHMRSIWLPYVLTEAPPPLPNIEDELLDITHMSSQRSKYISYSCCVALSMTSCW